MTFDTGYRVLTDRDLQEASKDLADRLLQLLKSKRVERIDIDCICCAAAGYLWGVGNYGALAKQHDLDRLTDLTLRKFVEGVG